MGSFIEFATQDSLWGKIVFTLFGVLLAGALIAAICKNLLPEQRMLPWVWRLLAFGVLLLALLKYNQWLISAIGLPAELVGFLILPGVIIYFLSAGAFTGAVTFPMQLMSFVALTLLLVLLSGAISFFGPYHVQQFGAFVAKACVAAISVAVVMLARKALSP
ncbi:hypothetical protein [Serratia quinivorans]|uniref:hypothetical protein n=1 Tax=Serratia quinivorans TaxID=137545 RepID=UPI003F96F39A